MEFKVNEYQLPDKLTFNYEELKQELTEKVNEYKTLIYSDEQIKEAKADRASLNKLKTALNDERIRREKEYMQPFNEFKSKVAEIIKIIDEPIALIDAQVKGYEDKKKAEKLESVKKLWEETEKPEGLTFENVFDEKMLNASYNMAHVKQKFADDIKRFERDLETLANLPEFGFEATEVYKTTLDINKAISEAQNMARIAKAKAEQEKAKAEAEAKKAEYEATQAAKLAEQMAVEEQENVSKTEQVEPQPPQKKNWVRFAATTKANEFFELCKFFDDRSIEYNLSFNVNINIDEAVELKKFLNDKTIEYKAI